jgi:hypothetical protein
LDHFDSVLYYFARLNRSSSIPLRQTNVTNPRDLSFKVDLPPETGPIFAMIPRKGHLEIFARDATYAALTPDQMDQARKHPNMPPALKKLASVGSASPIVARVYLQPREIMANFPLEHSTSEEILEHFHACKDAILQAEQVASDLLGEYQRLWAAANGPGFKIVDGVLHAPHIENLNLRIGDFFRHSKMAVQSVGEAFNSFYGLQLGDGLVKNGNFDFARKYLARQANPFQDYLDFLNQSNAVTAMIVRARNGFDHPGPDTLTITNFDIRDGGVVAPLWNFPSEKPTAVFRDIPVIMSSLVQFAEGNFVHCFRDNINIGLAIQVVPIPESQIDPNCPICLRLEIAR